MRADQQADLAVWAAATFPEGDDDSIMDHLAEEVGELEAALAFPAACYEDRVTRREAIAEELADCIILATHLASRYDLVVEDIVADKMERNKRRRWQTERTGKHWRHVEDDENGEQN